MSLLAMFRRKKQDVAEASPEETGTVAPMRDEAADSDAGAGASDAVEALTASADDEAAGAEAGDADGPEAAAAVAGEVEIPKQQSAEAAADNETGEGARR
ncbi:hypothetical protein [Streptomyces sp. LMG1-1-1.1]|uniref:hypothetical protein n=1 Tax=Streptomyces sp. LMG1-1-1.1 TaxID=3135245 RepID=UPI003467653A